MGRESREINSGLSHRGDRSHDGKEFLLGMAACLSASRSGSSRPGPGERGRSPHCWVLVNGMAAVLSLSESSCTNLKEQCETPK